MKHVKGVEFAEIIGCSINVLIELKRLQHLPMGARLTDDDIAKYRTLYKEWLESKRYKLGTRNKKYYDYYLEALKILRKDGFIERLKVLKIFHTTEILNVNVQFEQNDEPLIKDKVTFVQFSSKNKLTFCKHVTVYRLFSDIKKGYRLENKIYGYPPKNGFVVTNQRGSF